MTVDRHLSALTLDALALGALDPDTVQHVEAHLVNCAACRTEQAMAAALREQFTRSVLPRGLRARRSRGWSWLAVPAFAVLLAIVLVPRRAQEPPDDLAIKGDASWQVFAHRDGQTFGVRDGAVLAAGDQIRFAVLPAGARYLLVGSVDSSGAITIYYPYEGTESAAIAGVRIELPGSIVLDDAPGPERIFALLSEDPITADTLRAQLRAIALGGADAIRGTRALQIPARAQLSLVFEKAER